jgi:hypothetical protein
MNEETKNLLGRIGRLLSACLSLGALAMFFYILFKCGILPLREIIGPNKEYEQGWALFFFLIFGIPCLVLFIAGLVPWILWDQNRRKKKKAATPPPVPSSAP